METIPRLLERAGQAHALRPAFAVRRDGAWHTTSWADYAAQARRVGRALMAAGIAPGHGVVVMGFNRPEWFLTNLGAMLAGALPTGIYTTSTPEQCRYIADHCEARVAVVENAEYLRKLLGVRASLPRLRTLVVMEPADVPRDEGVLSWDEFTARAESVDESALDARVAACRPEDVAVLIYTSGTTGNPKAVALTHANLSFMALTAARAVGLTSHDRFLSYLPLCHIAEQLISHYLPVACGACTCFAESFERVPENLREVRPTLFFAVPRVWEKMQAAIQAAGAKNPPLRRSVVAWARRVGLTSGRAEQSGRRRPWTYALADRLVFRKVRARLGLDQARLCAVSSAPIAAPTLDFFLSLGLPLMEVYGMSEVTGASTLSLPDAYRTGWAGRAFPGTELRLAPDGEILLRGPHVFKGYYKDEAATRETLDAEGFVHSGDLGELSDDGYVRVTDRKKELIITAGGKNVAPQPIEGRLRQIPGVSQAAVVGDRRPYLVALLTLDPGRLAAAATQAGSAAGTAADAAACGQFESWLDQEVRQVNQGLARYEQVRRFALLPREFSVEAGELTPTLKLKRRVIAERHGAAIEALYAAAPDP